MFLRISQYSQDRCFLVILRNFQEHLFWRTSTNGCFCCYLVTLTQVQCGMSRIQMDYVHEIFLFNIFSHSDIILRFVSSFRDHPLSTYAKFLENSLFLAPCYWNLLGSYWMDDFLCQSPYSVRIPENKEKKNLARFA